MQQYPEPLDRLIQQLRKLPGIGIKTAQRLAFHMLKRSEEDARQLSEAIVAIKTQLIYCEICGNITDVSPCHICQDPDRDGTTICVVEEPDDLLAFERTREYNGLYHVLMGVLSPLEGVNPEDLRMAELFARINNNDIHELILATNHTVEGEATANYLARRLEGLGIILSRIAYGIPVGGDLEYIDVVTLGKALTGRRTLSQE